MKIMDFLKALLPHIEKDTLVEDLRTTLDELDKVAVPMYNQAATFFKVHKVQSKEIDALSNIFKRSYTDSKHPKQPNFIADIAHALPHLRDNVEFTMKQAEEILSEDILSEGLTAKKALVVRSCELMSFITRYSIDLLNFCYEAEGKAVGAADSQEAIKIAPITREKIQLKIADCARLLADYGMDSKKFAASVASVPDLFINSKVADTVGSIYKEIDIDPFNKSFRTGFIGSPIYHARLIFAEWQTARYNSAKEKKTILELRLLYLKNQDNKKDSSALEREIQYTQGRIDKIDRHLKSVEDDLGV